MDRPRPRALAVNLAVGISAAGALALAAGPADPPIRGMRWAAKEADPVATFTRDPAECLREPEEPQAALSVEIGRAAFRTPVLLGGQAARAGLACDTCHRAGRRNPSFVFPGVSDAPGTADVTSSLFSTHRGDGVFNPKRIPDLAADKPRLIIDQTPGTGRLEHFLHGLITEEFDGPEPPKPVLAGVAAYVRALSPEACPADATRPVTVAYYMEDARRAVRAAGRTDDRATAVLMLASARSRLGLIDERFPGPDLAGERAALRTADRGLAQLQEALRTGQPHLAPRLDGWVAESQRLEARLTAAAARSLFDPARLSQAAKRRLPG